MLAKFITIESDPQEQLDWFNAYVLQRLTVLLYRTLYWRIVPNAYMQLSLPVLVISYLAGNEIYIVNCT